FNHSIRGEANMRLYEAMACGAVPLVEASNQEAAILFQEGRHYFRYEPATLERTLDALLADPARVETVSTAAREAVGRYTKTEQIRSLLGFAGLAAGRPASASDGFSTERSDTGPGTYRSSGIPAAFGSERPKEN